LVIGYKVFGFFLFHSKYKWNSRFEVEIIPKHYHEVLEVEKKSNGQNKSLLNHHRLMLAITTLFNELYKPSNGHNKTQLDKIDNN
jgi:hypothetical protein